MTPPIDQPKEIVRSELITDAPAVALAGLLGVETPAFAVGAPLPMLWHWLYTLERLAQRELGHDGHPVRGVIPAPPGPGRRRMWAGGSVVTTAPLRCGVETTRYTRAGGEVIKRGRSGEMTFVTVHHEISQDGQVAVRERQDIVYRGAPPPDTQVGEPAPADLGVDGWAIAIDLTVLFRFSALTYNSHRIHYDRDYATRVEGYPSLVTHGPLQAIAMAEAARREGIDTAVGHRLDYRLVSPLYDHQGLVASCDVSADGGASLRIADRTGRVTARGTLARI